MKDVIQELKQVNQDLRDKIFQLYERLYDDGVEHKAAISFKQAQIDRLMLEYCPDEMTQEQKDNWAKNQRRAEFEMEE